MAREVPIALFCCRVVNVSCADVKTVLLTTADDSTAYRKYVAMYDFTARNFDELSLKAGDHVLVNVDRSIYSALNTPLSAAWLGG